MVGQQDSFESIHPKSRAEFRAWLEQNWRQPTGVWVITYKKATGLPRVEYDDLVVECLCFGWIDSKPGLIDEERSRLYIAPRKLGSNWSKINKDRAEKAIALGLMAKPGLDKIEVAKRDGSWNALDEVEALVIPADLRIELRQYPDAESNFTRFPKSAQRGILEWILNAKRPETRQKRIAETARLASENKRANQWRT
jgi:uncharacterized protein YdeI (YjbR/CyaY-like superfamily)